MIHATLDIMSRSSQRYAEPRILLRFLVYSPHNVSLRGLITHNKP